MWMRESAFLAISVISTSDILLKSKMPGMTFALEVACLLWLELEMVLCFGSFSLFFVNRRSALSF